MIIALILAAYALISLLVGPQVLTRGGWRIFRPRLCLGLWYAVFLSGVLAVVGSGAIGIWLGWRIQAQRSYGGDLLASTFGFRPTAGLDTVVRVTGVVLGWTTLALAGAMISLVATRARQLIDDERRLRADLGEVIARSGYRHEQIDGLSVTYVAGRGSVACTLGGRTAEVILSADLDLRLSAGELRAVIEHERAHLRGAHLLVSRLAMLNRACFPGIRAAQQLTRATALLIELIADDAAVRRCGRDDLISALGKLAETGRDDALVLRAQRLALAA
jgi:Zn-dependent protease with chaperone function